MNNNHDFIVGVVDTDSTSYCKSDMSSFSQNEIDALIKELNDISPEFMIWENDGYYETCIIIRAKNYVLKEQGTGKITFKGSATKDQKKELILQQLLKEMLLDIVDNGLNYMNLTAIYDKYVNQVIEGVIDIKPWCSKKTITEKILNCAGHESMTKEEKKEKGIRKNESDIYDAVSSLITQEGDKVYLYPVKLPNKIETGRIGKNGKPLKDKTISNNGLRLAQDWVPGSEDKHKLLERIYATVSILDTILDMSNFKDYSVDFESKLE